MRKSWGLPPEAFGKQGRRRGIWSSTVRRDWSIMSMTARSAPSPACTEKLLPVGGRVLDLMSSWVSHLPPGRSLEEVVGHGMNRGELESNPDLDRFFVQDLNRSASLPERDGWFDAVLVCVGVQYLQRPLAVFREVRRVLRSDGGRGGQLLEPLLPDEGRRGLARAGLGEPGAACVALSAEVWFQLHRCSGASRRRRRRSAGRGDREVRRRLTPWSAWTVMEMGSPTTPADRAYPNRLKAQQRPLEHSGSNRDGSPNIYARAVASQGTSPS